MHDGISEPQMNAPVCSIPFQLCSHNARDPAVSTVSVAPGGGLLSRAKWEGNCLPQGPPVSECTAFLPKLLLPQEGLPHLPSLWGQVVIHCAIPESGWHSPPWKMATWPPAQESEDSREWPKAGWPTRRGK